MSSEVGDASNILLRTPALNSGEARTCCDLLSMEDPRTSNVIAVTYTRTASTWISDYRTHIGSFPDRMVVISVGEQTRSSAQAQSSGLQSVDGNLAIETVENPNDLTEIGIRISERLSEFHEESARTMLCFDSVTALLQYTDRQTAFKFFHTVTSRIDQADASGHYHMTPDAHDERTVATLSRLFDTAIDVPEDREE